MSFRCPSIEQLHSCWLIRVWPAACWTQQAGCWILMEQASSFCPGAVWHIVEWPVLALGVFLPGKYGLCLLPSDTDCKASAAAFVRGLIEVQDWRVL